MRFAYADPPYFGCGESHYGEHHDEAAVWDSKQSHLDLIARLSSEFSDGWALSCNPRDLAWLLPACPEGARVAAWCKTWHQIRPTTVQFAWEPVIFAGGRKENKRSPMVRDWIACTVTRQKGLKGAKPPAFNRWVLDLLNYRDGDELIDIFPGSGGMGQVLDMPTLNFDDQHPTWEDAVQGTLHMAHCDICGTYIDDWRSEPPRDLLCSDCHEAEETA